MEDKDIIALYWQRDQRAVGETQSRYGGYCLSIARNILGSKEDAEECVNDALFNAWNSIPPHRPRVLPAFLGSLTRCAALKKWRDTRAQKRGGGEISLVYEELSECLPDRCDVESQMDTINLASLLNGFVGSLPQTERRVFLCRYWYCDSIDDISARFGFSRSKVKSMLHRTRGKLYSLLQKEGVLE